MEIDTRKLASVGVQLNALIKDLQAQNIILPSGNIDADGTRILLETSGDFPNVRAIETMLTRVGTTDSLVRLADLVTVRRGYVSPKVKPIYFNGRPAVVLSIVMQPDQDVTQLGERLRAAARNYEASLPIGYVIDFATYQAEQVRSLCQLRAFKRRADLRRCRCAWLLCSSDCAPGLIAAMIVPFAVMFSVIGMRVLGIAIEQVSIAAIIIALGLLVDNGVVIVEDIMSRIDHGMPANDAALAAGQQYAFPLLVSSVTTVAAFLPLFLLSGASGEYAFSLAAVVALTLTGSWIAALYILPALTVWFLGRSRRPQSETSSSTRVQALYASILRIAIRFPVVVACACFVLVALAVMQFKWLPKQMFPLSERNQFLIYMNMPDGTDISQTETRALEISKWLADPKQNPEIASHILYIGDGGPRFYLTLTPVPPDPAAAFFLVNTKDYQGAIRAADRAWKYLYENHPEARFKIKRLAMGSVEAGIVDVEISGPDADRLLALGAQVRSLFQAAPGIRDNDDDWGNKVLKVVIDINQDRVRQLGITSEEITQMLKTYFSGSAVSIYREGDNTIPIALRAGAATYQSLEGLTSATFAKNGSTDPACADRHVENRFRFLANTSKKPGEDDYCQWPKRLFDGGRFAEFYSARLAGIGPIRRISHRHWRRDSKERGDQRQTCRGHSGRPRCDGDCNYPAIQFVPSDVADLHDHTSDSRRHSLWPAGNRAAAVVLWHARHHQSRGYHHQQCHRAYRSDRYRKVALGAARGDCRRFAEALASDPADVGDDGSWPGADGDRRRRTVAADGSAYDVGSCRGFAC